MPSGRPPKPAAMRELEGDRGKRARPAPAVDLPASIPTPPAWLSAEAKAEWRRVGKILFAQGVISHADRAAFAAYCNAWSLFQRANKEMEGQDLVVESPNGVEMPNPRIAIANKQAEIMDRFLVHFGLSPVARQKLVGAAGPKKKPISPVDAAVNAEASKRRGGGPIPFPKGAATA